MIPVFEPDATAWIPTHRFFARYEKGLDRDFCRMRSNSPCRVISRSHCTAFAIIEFQDGVRVKSDRDNLTPLEHITYQEKEYPMAEHNPSSRLRLLKEIYSLEVKPRDGIVLEKCGFNGLALSTLAGVALPGAEIIRVSESQYQLVVPYNRATPDGPERVRAAFNEALEQAYDKLAGL